MVKTVKSMLSWAKVLLTSSKKERKEAKNIALDGILKYNKGIETKEGQELVRFLKKDCELVGFVPHIAYIKDDGADKGELESVWVHPFAQRTLLYKIKGSPCLILVNSSIELNDSSLRKIKGNHKISELLNIGGITG